MNLTAIAKKILYSSGLFGLVHQIRNRHTLTVLMFHRVLPREEMQRLGADPLYVLSPRVFSEILQFVNGNYHCVSLEQVMASRAGRERLPDHALLVTFDDGWRDNLLYAAPLLSAAKIPAVLFAATDALTAPEIWWQETLLWALRSNAAKFDALWHLAGHDEPPKIQSPGGRIHALLLRYAGLAPQEREQALAPFTALRLKLLDGNEMLSAEDLRMLAASGWSICSHGASHLPMTALEDPAEDIRRARYALFDRANLPRIDAMSFPHGRYDEKTVAAATDAGLSLMFTSETALNACAGGIVGNVLAGRVEMAESAFTTASGQLLRERLAFQLFLCKTKPH